MGRCEVSAIPDSSSRFALFSCDSADAMPAVFRRYSSPRPTIAAMALSVPARVAQYPSLYPSSKFWTAAPNAPGPSASPLARTRDQPAS